MLLDFKCSVLSNISLSSLTHGFQVLTYLILRKKTCCKAIACCGVIIAGYITSVLQENGLGKF